MNSFQDQLYSFMQEFREKFYREKAERQYSLKEPARRKPRDEEQPPRPRREKGIELIASLRKKAEQGEKAR